MKEKTNSDSEYLGPEKENKSDDLYEHFRFVAQKGQQPLRVDKFLMNYIEKATRSKIQKAAKDGTIRVNDIPVRSSYKVKPDEDRKSVV